MKRSVLAATTVTLALAIATPAWAHEEITPASVPTGTPVFFTLSAANEKRVDVTRVTLTPPEGTELGHATRDPVGWTTSSFSHAEAVWTGGAIKPSRFEQFGFDIEEAAQPRTLTFKVVLAYADGTTSEAQLPVTVTAAAAQRSADVSPDRERNDGQATAALVFALLALLVATGAVVLALRTRFSAGQVTPNTRPASQDW